MSDNDERLRTVESQVAKHDRLFRGDLDTDPPRPGLQQVLTEIYNAMHDEESGNKALHKRTTMLEKEDTKRVAWVLGVKWVVAGLVALIGFALGLAVAWKHG